jgi:hypothetical protein
MVERLDPVVMILCAQIAWFRIALQSQ